MEEIWGIHAIPTPNALAGSQFLYEHPESRAEDFMWARQNKEVNGIICMMGGDDSYRVLPYIDLNVIKDNPKVFMGYSDITSWMAVFAKAGIRAYYGPNLLTPIAQPVALDAAGMFKHAAGIIVGQLSEEEENMLVKFLKYEVRREDIPVLSIVDFVHRTPMAVMPMGAMAELDCSCVTFKIMESGVVE